MNNTITKSDFSTISAATHKTKVEKLLTKLIYNAVLFSFITSIFYSVYNLAVLAQTNNATNHSYNHSQSDYVLMLLQCIAGLAVIHLPIILEKCFKVNIPSAMQIFFSIFLFCAVFLGEVTSFYYLIPHWDDILHGSSGIMTGLLGFMLIAVLNKKQKANLNISPFFMAMFAFCFAIAIGTVWEIYEFGMDAVLGLNMQKAVLENGEALIGHLAVVDTMKDIIVDTCGAFTAAAVGYISLKHKKGWVHNYINNNANTAIKSNNQYNKAA